jgi:hypothetical protein
MLRPIFKLKPDYVWEKLFTGLTSIAESEAPLVERLANAYMPHLNQLECDNPSDIDVPHELFLEIQALLQELGERFVGRTSSHKSTMKNLDDELAVELIRKLVMLYGKVVRLLPEEHVAVAPGEDG